MLANTARAVDEAGLSGDEQQRPFANHRDQHEPVARANCRARPMSSTTLMASNWFIVLPLSRAGVDAQQQIGNHQPPAAIASEKAM